jgi:tRNA dimethylallyltransferase
MAAHRPSVAVIGPTASGKSAVAMAAARATGDIELVSVDAMQVYQGMDIGTAKPTPGEQAEVPHHLIDLADPWDDFTVARFQRAFDEAVEDIARRDRRPLLVGGTGLYLRAVVDSLTLPGEWPELRRRFESDPDLPGLYERLARIDPPAAAKIEPTNRRRIARALEVCEGSGRPFSSFGPGVDTYPESPVVQLALRWPRPVLAERIDRRVQEMMNAGLLDEVRNLLDHPRGLSRTARQALGYKELIDHLEGRASLDAAVDAVVTRTRQLAVRQERWFRRDPRVRWIDIEADPVIEALPAVLAALDAMPGDR